MKKKEAKKKVVKKKVVLYFTDEMHSEIFAFQPGYSNPKGGKPSVKPLTIKF